MGDTFDFVVPAQEVIFGKSDGEILARAADSIGLYGGECAGIGDAEAGIAAVKAASKGSVGVGEATANCSCDLSVQKPSLLTARRIIALFHGDFPR